MLNVLHLSYFQVCLSFALTPELHIFDCTVPSSFVFHDTFTHTLCHDTFMHTLFHDTFMHTLFHDTFMHTRNFHTLYTVCTFLPTAIYLNINIKYISFFPVVLSLSLSLLQFASHTGEKLISPLENLCLSEYYIIIQFLPVFSVNLNH